MTTRPLKFRAFSQEVKQWYYSDDEAYVLKEINGTLCLMEMDNFYNARNDMELSIIGEAFQYTGLKDKHGTEIYEGDIVMIEDRIQSVCKWFNHHAHFSLQTSVGLVSVGFAHKYDGCQQVVIGNIIENPELLEETK